METFLNLVWLAVALAAIWLWRFRWAGSRQNPIYSSRMEAAAMVCLLALLFPVISLTDDLHPETAVVDAASGKRNAILIAASASHVRSSTLTPGSRVNVGTIVRPFVGAQLASVEYSPVTSLHILVWIAGSNSGRSPPALL
jgi:hypothetical protein